MFRRLGAFFLDILEVIVFAVAIFLFIYLLVLQPHKIKGASMDPNFFDGEYLLTDKVTYRFGEPKRGDVIVFKAPTGNGDEFIKRIIGLPGEKVSVKSGKMYINEKVLEEKVFYTMEDTQIEHPREYCWQVGMKVSHPSFGTGIIKATEGMGEKTKLTVCFPGAGTKKLLARYTYLIPVPF